MTWFTLNYFLKNKHDLKEKGHAFGVDVERLLSCKYLTDVVEEYWSPAYGFKSPEELHKAVDPTHFVTDIHVPTMCLITRDDPICRGTLIPHETFRYV
jgi:predicted alpha/beta-fold hydrolase